MVLKGEQELPFSTSPRSSPLPSPICVNTTLLYSMDHAVPFQSHWTTTPVSEPGQPNWHSDQHLRAGTWSDDTVWVYSNPSDTTAAEKRVDDNWGKLYQAILDFNQPPSIVANTLQFREEVPLLLREITACSHPCSPIALIGASHSQPLMTMRHQSPSLGLPQLTLQPPRLELRTMMQPQDAGNPYN